MPVIAMTREMGSKGKDVAIGLAEQMGIHIVHHNLVEHSLSEKLQALESDVHRHLEGKTNLLDRWKLPDRNLSEMTACEVLELAEHGNVIIRGWGSTHLLRSVDHVLRVRVCAPLEARVATLMERLDTDDEAFAHREIQTNDVAHTRMLTRLIHADWQDPLLYDLTINTERMPIEEGVALIEHTLQLPSFQENPESQARLKQLRIESQLRATLATDASLNRDAAVINFDVDPVTHGVTLSGGVRQAATRERMHAKAAALEGVPEVVDHIQLVRE